MRGWLFVDLHEFHSASPKWNFCFSFFSSMGCDVCVISAATKCSFHRHYGQVGATFQETIGRTYRNLLCLTRTAVLFLLKRKKRTLTLGGGFLGGGQERPCCSPPIPLLETLTLFD
jgi:hypothetical protein